MACGTPKNTHRPAWAGLEFKSLHEEFATASRVDPKKLGHEFWMMYAGSPSLFGAGLGDDHVPTC